MGTGPLIEEALSKSVIGAFYDVYNDLGYGFMESTYAQALERELKSRGHTVQREVSVRVYYKGEYLRSQRLDMLVDARLIIENKAGAELPRHATRQLFSYLHGTTLEIGLVLHFGPEPRFHAVVCKNDQKGFH